MVFCGRSHMSRAFELGLRTSIGVGGQQNSWSCGQNLRNLTISSRLQMAHSTQDDGVKSCGSNGPAQVRKTRAEIQTSTNVSGGCLFIAASEEYLLRGSRGHEGSRNQSALTLRDRANPPNTVFTSLSVEISQAVNCEHPHACLIHVPRP